MQNSALNFNIMFLPIDMISSWKRANLSSSFCANILSNKKSYYIHNIVSTVINECLELSIKHGVKKTENYAISCIQDNENTTIKVSLYLELQQIIMLKSYLKKIQSIKTNHEFETILFTKEFSDLGYAIYSLINEYKGSLDIKKESKQKNTPIKTTLTITLSNQKISNDH